MSISDNFSNTDSQAHHKESAKRLFGITHWFHRRWSILKTSFPYEWKVFCRAWWGILIGIVFQILHNWAHNGVFYLASHYKVYGGPQLRLVDLGFKLFPSLEHLPFLPSNGCLYFLFVVAIVFAIRPLFFNCTCGSTVQMVWRLLVVCSFTIAFRCISFLVTILPSPAPHCAKGAFDAPTTGEVFGRLDTEGGCSDLIFSSHVMYGSLCCLIVAHYSIVPYQRANKRLPWHRKLLIAFMYCVLLAECCFIVAQRAHYTVDVFISLYTIPATWLAFYCLVPNDPKPRISADNAKNLATEDPTIDIETGSLPHNQEDKLPGQYTI